MGRNFDPNEVQWFDGMVLSCHQFQQEQIRLKSTANYLLNRSNPYGWGVVYMKSSLGADGMFVLEELECILPDYSILFFPQYDAAPIEVNIQDDSALYCVVANDYTCSQATSRYDSVYSAEVADINTGDNRQKVFRMNQRFSITTEKPPVNSLNFPIAIRNRTYDPPAAVFTDTKYAQELVQKLIDTLWQKIVEHAHRDHMNYKSILPELIPLKALIESKNPGTFEVYQQTLRLCGKLISLDDTQPSIPSFSYDHTDIYSSFLRVCEFAKDVFNRISKNHGLDLKEFKIDNGRFACMVPSSQKGYADVLLHFDQKVDAHEWISNAIIASHDAFEDAKLNRTIGCRREVIESSGSGKSQVRITYSKEYVKSNLLWIENALTNIQPRKIFLM